MARKNSSRVARTRQPAPSAALNGRPLREFVSIARRYTRSVNLERDLGVAHSVRGYIPTTRALELLSRVLEAAGAASANRAWTLTGPYGTGKSAFAHFVATLLGPQDDAGRREAVALLEAQGEVGQRIAEVAPKLLGKRGTGMVRAIVTAQRESVTTSVLRALERGAVLRWAGRQGRPPDVLDEVQRAAKRAAAGKPIAGTEVLRLVGAVADASQAGLLLVIDELGKNLEYAARSGGKDDMYLLQQLTELPREEGAPPVLVLGLLHQGFADYAASLTSVQRTEWTKVQGRFEDVPFADGPEQMLRLTAEAIQQAFPPALADAAAGNAAAWQSHITADLGNAYVSGVLTAETIARTLPLHPLAALVLPSLCMRYGQHDRSLFTFLASQEPHAFGHLLAERTIVDDGLGTLAMPLIGIADLYDYFVESALSGGVVRGNVQRWAEVHSVVQEAKHLDADAIRALKTIGALNLVASAGGALRASRALVQSALMSVPEQREVSRWEKAIALLETRSVVTYRRQADELRVWEGSDFDVDAAVRQRLEGERVPLHEVLARVAPLAPMVAQRHSYETGTLRCFDRVYVAGEAALKGLRGGSAETDGVVAYWTGQELPEQVPATTADGLPLLVVLPMEHAVLAAAAAEAAALEYIDRHAVELQRDGVARREVRQRLVLARRSLDAAIRQAYEHPKGQPCWVGGQQERLAPRQLNRWLSDLCDKTYPSGPRLWNEIINRRELTSQGARARRELIEAMIGASSTARLGLVGDGPEVSMYASVLLESGIHRQEADGTWAFGAPTTPGLQPVWAAIESFCVAARGEARTLDGLQDMLIRPPYGVKRGVIPVLVAAVLLTHADDISVYRDGTFLPTLGAEHFEILVKQPGRFAVKHFALSGIRWEMFRELEAVVRQGSAAGATGRAAGRNATLLRVVRPLIRFAVSLPPSTLKSRTLSPEAIVVRDALRSAREPDDLLFSTLPTACGLPLPTGESGQEAGPEYVATFRRKLVEVLRELETAYERLLDRCRQLLHHAFGVTQDETRLREALRVRAHPLAAQCVEPRLRAFVLAAAADEPSDRAWLEALAMIVADKPVDAWSDDDALAFELNLGDVARRFINLEALHKDLAARGTEGYEARRVTITSPDGGEIHRFVWLDRQQRGTVDALVGDLTKMLESITPEQQAAVVTALTERVLRDRNVPMIQPTPAAEAEVTHGAARRPRAGGGASARSLTQTKGPRANYR